MGIQLSKRMSALASLVTEGSRLADIGTDHGYIPIALVQKGRIPSALAMDVGKGPLSRAREHIHSQGLDTYIETRLSDGLTELHEGEADTVLIAGMGGMLMKRILEGGGALPVQCWGTDFAAPVRDPSGAEVPGGAWLSDHGRGHSAGGWKILSHDACRTYPRF